MLTPGGCGRDEKVKAALASLIKAAPKLEKLAIPGDFEIGLVRAATTEVLICEPFDHPYHACLAGEKGRGKREREREMFH